MDQENNPKLDTLICKLCRATRISLGLSQAALAKSAGLSRDKLTNWEKGRAKISEEERGKLAAVLCDAMDLKSVMTRASELGLAGDFPTEYERGH